jgi:autotransporter-associated beta strand protein
MNNSATNPLIINAAIADQTLSSPLIKTGAGELIINGTNTYTGTTTVADGLLRLGGSVASTTAEVLNGTLQTAGNLPATAAVTLSGTSTLDLFGASQTVASLANVAGNTLTNSSTGAHASTATTPGSPALTDALTITANVTANSLPLLVTDGPTRKTQVVLNNANGNNPNFLTNNANSFSGGVVLAHNATNGTRLQLNGTNSGAVGTGPIIIGQANTDKAGVYFSAANTFANDIVFNTALGTDRVGLRADAAVTLSGKITANLAPATFTSNSGIAGNVTVTGQVTGASGLVLDITSLSAAATNFNVTLNNAGTPNNYGGDTVINLAAASGKSATLNLGAPEQIPHGAATGNVVINSNGTGAGTLNLAGFSETINGLSGNGIVESGSGTPTLTLGENNASGSFSGAISNTAGTLALVKTGMGTQTLSGVNTYTGTTTVSQGTLALVGGSQASPITVSAGASLGFDIAAATTSTSTFNLSTGTIKITGSPTLNSYDLIIDSAGITGTPVLDAPVAGYELKVEGNSLKLVKAGYAAWAAINAIGSTPDQDKDGDGVANAIEYVLGGDVNTNDLSKLPQSTISGTNLVFTFLRDVDTIDGSTAVTIEVGTTLAAWPAVYTVGADTAGSTPGVVVTEDSSPGFDTITLTVPMGTDPKKFARLKVVVPD